MLYKEIQNYVNIVEYRRKGEQIYRNRDDNNTKIDIDGRDINES